MAVITVTTTSNDEIRLNQDQVVFSQGMPNTTSPTYYHCLCSSGTFLDLTSDPLPTTNQ